MGTTAELGAQLIVDECMTDKSKITGVKSMQYWERNEPHNGVRGGECRPQTCEFESNRAVLCGLMSYCLDGGGATRAAHASPWRTCPPSTLRIHTHIQTMMGVGERMHAKK